MIRSEELAPAMAALIAEVSLAGAAGGLGSGSTVSMLLIGCALWFDAAADMTSKPRVDPGGDPYTPHFYKIVRTALKANGLVFALGEKSAQRVRNRMKTWGLLF